MRGSLEGRLRALPGVLECSSTDGSVSVHVHPEADLRLIQARAQALFAECGDARPLMVSTGMAPPPPARLAGSPLLVAVFALAVLLVLAVVPTAPRDGGTARPTMDAATATISFAADPTPELARRPRVAPAPRAVVDLPTVPIAAVAAAAPVPPPKPAKGKKQPARRRHAVTAPVVSAVSIEAACVPAKKDCQPGAVGRSKARARTSGR